MAGNVPIPKVAVWLILLQCVASLYRPVWKIASKGLPGLTARFASLSALVR